MIKRVFRKMTAAQIVSAATVTICLLVDSIVIGRLIGVDAMSAYGLANPLLTLFTSLGMMVSVGVQVMIGDSMGRGDKKGCRSVYSTTIAISIIMAAVWIAVVFGATRQICVFLGAGDPSPDNSLFRMTANYLRGFIIGAPFYFLSQIMIPFLQVMGKRRLLVVSTIAMTVSDIAFDLLSVFVFRAGLFGVGFASSLSYLVATLVGIGFFLQKDCIFKFDLKGVNLKTVLQIFHAGSPVIIGQACFVLRIYFINKTLLAVSGAVAVAAYSVITTVGTICFCIGLGSGSVTLMLSSIFWSEQDRSSLYELIHVSTRSAMALIISAVAVVELAAPFLIKLFLGNDPNVLAIAVPGIRIYILSLIPCVLATVMKNYYQGIRHMGLANFISLCNNALLLIPCVWICSKLMGLTGIWIGVIAGETATVLAAAIVAWIKHGGISFTVETFSLLDSDFGADPSDVFEMSVTDHDMAVVASSYVNEFCKMKGLENRVSMLVSLCVEEIVLNTIEHGFTSDDHPHNADIRLVVDDTKCIIRIRDNCIGFDPTQYIEMHQDSDPSSHIGIRIVMGMANEVHYINSLGLNNLYISILK